MNKKLYVLLGLLLATGAVFLVGCGTDSQSAAPIAQAPTTSPATATPVPPTATPLPPTATPIPPTPTPIPTQPPAPAQPQPFTAGTGLDTFDNYQLDFEVGFDGEKEGVPSTGSLSGALRSTKAPFAQHWNINIDGAAFPELALLGNKVEMYNFGDNIFVQNPADNTWVGVPSSLLSMFLPVDPSEMFTPETAIALPAQATRQPQTEIIDGVQATRYTFNEETPDSVIYGEIWVSDVDNYVLVYNAKAEGNFSNYNVGGVKLLDEGEITMSYRLNNPNGDLVITPPAHAQSINLGSLLFN